MNNAATIKLFLPHGDAKRLRTGEISNWSGKALAAPRTELETLCARDELGSAGVYFLFGTDPASDEPMAYIGEAEVIRDRIKQHKSKEFWVSVVVFVSKDENLTKAHIRYLENRLIDEATKAGRYKLVNSNLTNSKLPESDREDMEVFLSRIQQMLPVLGSNLLTPVTGTAKESESLEMLFCKRKGALAKGYRTESGFVVLAGSTAVANDTPSFADKSSAAARQRKQLIQDGTLVEKNGFFVFSKDVEFSSPSTAAVMVQGGNANGLKEWKNEKGISLKDIEG